MKKMTKYSRKQLLKWIERWNTSMEEREKQKEKEKKKDKEKWKSKKYEGKKTIKIYGLWIYGYVCNRRSRNCFFVFKTFFKTKPTMKKNYEFEWLQENTVLYTIL